MFELGVFLPQLVATIVGVGLGIPIGLWLSSRASESQRGREEEQAKQRKLSSLSALTKEVEHNQVLLNQVEDELQKATVPLYLLDTGMWALLGSEVAQAVESKDALTHVSRLYFELGHLNRKLDALFQLVANPLMAASSEYKRRFTELVNSMLLQLPPTRQLCEEVLAMLGDEVEHMSEDSNTTKKVEADAGRAIPLGGKESLGTSAVSSFLASFLFLQARAIEVASESPCPVLCDLYLGLAVFFLLVASFLLFSALANYLAKIGERVASTLWLGIGYITIAGLIFSWSAGIAALSPKLFWHEWFFWLGFVWIVFYCVYFIREAREHGRQFRARR